MHISNALLYSNQYMSVIVLAAGLTLLHELGILVA